MRPDRHTLFAAMLALVGAACAIASVTMDLWTDGTPGIGSTQILGMGVGFAMIVVADGTQRGTILRLDVSDDSTYAIPADNPFSDADAGAE